MLLERTLVPAGQDLSLSLGTRPGSLQLDNPSSFWVYFPQLDRWVPPFFQRVRLRWIPVGGQPDRPITIQTSKTPAGYAAVAPVSQEAIRIQFFAEDAEENPGQAVTLTIWNTPQVVIQGNPTVQIAAGQSVAITGNPTVQIAAGQSVAITGTATVQFAAGQTVAISGTPTVQFAAGSTVAISGTPTVQFAAGQTVAISNITGGNITFTNAQIAVVNAGASNLNVAQPMALLATVVNSVSSTTVSGTAALPAGTHALAILVYGGANYVNPTALTLIGATSGVVYANPPAAAITSGSWSVVPVASVVDTQISYSVTSGAGIPLGQSVTVALIAVLDTQAVVIGQTATVQAQLRQTVTGASQAATGFAAWAQLAGPNNARKGMTIWNNSNQHLLIAFGQTAGAPNAYFDLAPGATYEMLAGNLWTGTVQARFPAAPTAPAFGFGTASIVPQEMT